jgi:Domain of unknown function (DUF1737)
MQAQTNDKVLSDSELGKVVHRVKELLKAGWEPLGSIQMSAPVVHDGISPRFAQTIIKRRPREILRESDA